MIGLSESNVDAHYNTIKYAIYLQGNGRVRVYENGSYRIDGSFYSIDDMFSVERKKETIYYKQNGFVIYTSAVQSANALIADVAFSNIGDLVDAKMLTTVAIKNFRATASLDDNSITLRWDVPDTSLDSEYAGARIVYRTDRYPANESDGTVLGNYNSTLTEVLHSNLNSEVTYYYAIFGYKTGPVYDSPLTASAISSDQIPPDKITNLTATKGIESITFNWNNPDVSVYPNQDFEGVMIRRSADSYPLDPDGGEDVAKVYGNVVTYTDSGLDPSITYYYSFFTFDEIPHYSDPVHISEKPIFNIQRLVIVPETTNGSYGNVLLPVMISGAQVSLKVVALSPEGNIVTTFEGSNELLFSSSYLTVNSGVIPTVGGSSLPLTRSLQFANGVSSGFSFEYLDSGIISLHAKYVSGNSSDDFETDSPVSVSFVPFSYYMDAVNDSGNSHFIAGKPFDLNIMSVVMDGDNNDLSDNLTTSSYQSSFVNLSVSSDGRGDLGKLSTNFISFLNGKYEGSLVYDSLGIIKISCFDSDYLGESILGISKELEFTPNAFMLDVLAPPARRDFFYIGETIEVEVSAMDYNNNILNDYIGDVEFYDYDQSMFQDLSGNYQFINEDAGKHLFSFSSAQEEVYSLSVRDKKFSDVNGTTSLFSVKYAKIIIDSKDITIGVDEVIEFKIVDADGNLIDTDDSTVCEVELKESKSNNSVTVSLTEIQVFNGVGSFKIKDSEVETVTLSLKTTPSLPVEEGVINFTTVQKTEIGQGGIRILFWKEVD